MAQTEIHPTPTAQPGRAAFAWAIKPELGLNLPGMPFALAGLMLLGACAIAWRVTR